MAARQEIPFKTSTTIQLVAPTDVFADPDNPLDNTTDGSTSTFRVIDPAKSEVLFADEATSQVALSVTNVGVFVVGDTVDVDLDDGTGHSADIDSIDTVAGTITVDVGLVSAAAAGNRVRVRLGNVITMTEYGTPDLSNLDWGFQGPLASDHGDLKPDLEINIEISFVGAVIGGLDLLKIICAIIKENKDCDC